MIIVPYVGARHLLDAQMGNISLGNPNYHLFKNDFEPDVSAVLASFTEADFGGYNPVTVSVWSAAVTVNDHAKTIGNLAEWISSDPVDQPVYGYFVTDVTNTLLLWCERDPNAPFVMQDGGFPYQIFPAFTRISEFMQTP